MTHAHWTLMIAPAWQDSLGDAASVLELLQQPDALVQENDRGTVSFVRHGGAVLVAKRSKTQERRRWTRLISLYRGGEGARAFRNLRRLRDLGLPVPEPVLVLERRRAGFVLASWHAYRYLEGQACTCADADAIARVLKLLHEHGWVHRDPHVRNFLKDGVRTHVIDCAKARPWRSSYAQRYDVVLLNKCCPGARAAYPGFSVSDPLYRLAQSHNNWIVRWRSVKRAIRGFLGIHRDAGGTTPSDGAGGHGRESAP